VGAHRVLQQPDLLRFDRVEEGSQRVVVVVVVVVVVDLSTYLYRGVAWRGSHPQNPIGVLAQLDDVCNFPKGTDEKFLQKLQEAFMQHAHFTMGGQNEFVIKHYAGDVRQRTSERASERAIALEPNSLLPLSYSLSLPPSLLLPLGLSFHVVGGVQRRRLLG